MSRLHTEIDQERYARHLLLPEIGMAGQQRLAAARVLVIGAGGLGSPVALYLAAAGVGTLVLVDHDVVALSNLQRQVLHTTARIGTPKVESAAATLHALNPATRVETYAEKVAEAHFARCDVIVDGSDNFATRYLVNDVAVRAQQTVVHGSIYRFDGQVSVFAPSGPCYRCLYPEPPPAALVPNCAEAGVLGVLPGMIGMIQATETLKLLLGIGAPLIGRVLSYDALAMQFRERRLQKNPQCNCARNP